MGGIIVVLIIIFYFYNRSQKKKVNAVYDDIENKRQTLENEKKEWEDRLAKLKDEIQHNKENLEEVKAEIVNSQKELFIKEVELNQIEYETSEEIKNQLSLLSLEEKELIKGEAIENTNFSQKKTYINNQIKQILRCFNAETDLILNNLTFKNVDSSRNKIIKIYEMLNKIFSVDNVSINEKFLDIKLRKLMLLFSHAQKLEDEKEQQKAIREQLVEEEKVRREIEQSKRKIEKEEQQFNNEISKLMSYLKKTDNDLEKELYISKIKDLEEKDSKFKKEQEDKAIKELEEKDILINIYNIAEYQKKLEVLLADKRIKEQEKTALEVKQEELIKDLEEIKNSLVTLDRTYLRYHDEELELIKKKEGLQSELNVIEERKNNRNLRSEKLAEDLKYLLERKENLTKKLIERQELDSINRAKIKSLRKEIADLEEGGEYNLEKIEASIDKLRDEYYGLITEETRLENSIEYAKKNIESADETYKELLENIEHQKSIYNTKLAELDKATKEKEELSSKLTVLENNLNTLLEEDILLVSKEKNIDEKIKEIEDEEKQYEMALYILEDGLSVEEAKKRLKLSKKVPKNTPKIDIHEFREIEEKFTNYFGAKAKIKVSPKNINRGQIILKYNSNEELERMLELLEK